jgi:hypothetical protein
MKKFIAATALATAVIQAPAHADGLNAVLGGIDFSVNGFGTAGSVITNTNNAQFVRVGENSGANKSAVWNVDSNLGVQGTARFTPWLSATVQLIEDSEYLTDLISWAYIKIDPVSNLSIKLGKVEMPLFLLSDSRDIGYANSWVRPPNEVYGLATNEELKGGEATYTLPVGSTQLEFTGYAGVSSGYVHQGMEQLPFNEWDVHGGEMRWNTTWVTLRGGLMKEHGDGYGNVFTFMGVGATMDHDNFVAQTELVKRTGGANSQYTSATGWYALAGYRVGPVLPYVSFAHTARIQPISPYYGVSGNQSTKAIGARWDFYKSVDLKFQLERVDPKGTQGISFVDEAPNFGNKEVTATSILVDFVF